MKFRNIIFAFFIGFLVLGCVQTTKQDGASLKVPVPGNENVEEAVVIEEKDSGNNQANVETFNVIAKQWEFDPGEIRVRQGDKVELNIKSIDVAHGFALPDFGINEKLEPNKEVKVEFVADKKGTFNFWCNVLCGEGHSEMRGKLIVE